MFKSCFGSNNDTLKFYENKKYTENFIMNFEYFYIYKKKYFLFLMVSYGIASCCIIEFTNSSKMPKYIELSKLT